jgi:hypothetical protein
MKFIEYLKKYNITVAEASDHFGLAERVIRKLIKGDNVSAETLRIIIVHTKEEVSANELLGFPRKPAKTYWRSQQRPKVSQTKKGWKAEW